MLKGVTCKDSVSAICASRQYLKLRLIPDKELIAGFAVELLSIAMLMTGLSCGYVMSAGPLAANKASQQATIASNEKLSAQDGQLRQTLLTTQISSEKDLANLQAELTRQNTAYNAQIQDQQSLLELTRGRNVDLQKSYLNIGSNFLTNAAAIYQDVNIPAEAKQNLINSLKLEMQALFDLGSILEAEPVLGAGQGGL